MSTTPLPPDLELAEARLQERLTARHRRNMWLALILIIAPLFWFVPTYFYMRNLTASQNASCQSTMKSLGAALLGYARDNNDQLPDAKDWIAVATRRTGERLHCVVDIDKTHPSSYAMNANLSGKKLSGIKNPHDVILLYESTSKAQVPFGHGEDLPHVGKDTVGVGRHHTLGYRFNYYLMADGSVRAPQNMDEVKTYKWTP
jgi:hypothetical protein